MDIFLETLTTVNPEFEIAFFSWCKQHWLHLSDVDDWDVWGRLDNKDSLLSQIIKYWIFIRETTSQVCKLAHWVGPVVEMLEEFVFPNKYRNSIGSSSYHFTLIADSTFCLWTQVDINMLHNNWFWVSYLLVYKSLIDHICRISKYFSV